MRILITSIISFILCSCIGGGYKQHLPDKYKKESVNNVHLISKIYQENIWPELEGGSSISHTLINNPNLINQHSLYGNLSFANQLKAATGTALVMGALSGVINAPIQRRNRSRLDVEVKPLQEALKGHNFNQLFHDKFTQHIKSHPKFDVNKVSTLNGSESTTPEVGEITFDAETFYTVTLDKQKIKVMTNVTISRVLKNETRYKSTQGDKKYDVIFQNKYIYVSDAIPYKTVSEEEKNKIIADIDAQFRDKMNAANISYKRELRIRKNKLIEKKLETESGLTMFRSWAQNDAEQAKKFLHESIDEITYMISKDITDFTELSVYWKDKSLPRYQPGFQTVEEKNNRVIVRVLEGINKSILCSVSTDLSASVHECNTLL